MAEFVYNNVKNADLGHMLFELDCGYHLQILYKNNVNSCFKSKLTDKLSIKLRELMIVYRKNLYHTQKLQKQAHNKDIKRRSYVFSNKT